MKSLSAVVVLLFVVPFTYGQLTIKPQGPHKDSYLYIKGSLLFVKQDVNLQKNADASPTEASIYLRNEAQLIQGEGATAANKGDGYISVFQEGTSNAYDYNYWASPVNQGEQKNFGIKMLHAPRNQTQSIPAIITNSLDGISDPLTISSRWIHTFKGSSYSDWNFIGESTVIPVGYGFSMKGVNGIDNTIVDEKKNNPGHSQRYDFRGTPNNGPVRVSIRSGETVLIGNPFPSALDLSLFLLENSGSGTFTSGCYSPVIRTNGITGIAYFWDSIENGNSHYLNDYVGGYGAFSPVDPCTEGIYELPLFRTYGSLKEETDLTGKYYNRRYLPIAQGFMVEGSGDTEITFQNHHRTFIKEGEHSDFKRSFKKRDSADLMKIPMIRFGIDINNSYTRRLTLAFWPSSTDKVDQGMDAPGKDSAPTDIGWFHENENFVIDVRPFEKTEKIPLFLKVDPSGAELQFRIIAQENIDIENIYLHDALSNDFYPLKEEPLSIQFDKGEYHSRYSIAFQKEKETSPEEALSPAIQMYFNQEREELEITNSTDQMVREIKIYDLTGKQVFMVREIFDNIFRISTSVFPKSVYIVKVLTEDHQEFSQKVGIHQ